MRNDLVLLLGAGLLFGMSYWLAGLPDTWLKPATDGIAFVAGALGMLVGTGAIFAAFYRLIREAPMPRQLVRKELGVYLPEDVYVRFRSACHAAGVSMSGKAFRLILSFVEGLELEAGNKTGQKPQLPIDKAGD